MPPKQATVLLTRPLADAQRFAAMLPGVDIVISPILRIVPVDHDSTRLANAPGLIFTSAHAVASAGPGRGRMALCVGPRTAQVAQEAGFQVTEGPGEAGGLARLIDTATVPLIHPHGRHVTMDLPVDDMIVYDQLPQPLSDQAVSLLSGTQPVILPIFSHRSALLMSQALDGRVTAPLLLAAISETALSGWYIQHAATRIAAQPNATGMRDAIIALLSPEQ